METSTLLTGLISFVVGVLLPMAFATFLPNKLFYGFGFNLGKKMSQEGNKLIGKSYEELENNLTGSVIAFAQGLEEGSNVDNGK